MTATPRLVIAGTHSGVGKTTVATALIASLARRGLRVQPFKIGPDFIDPGFHTRAAGRPSRNLDGWMLPRETNLALFAEACQGADMAVIEGVMGLFDGRDASGEAGSTAEMAKWLRAPVLLVVDASAMARSAAAVVRGFEEFDADLDLAGVLLNRVGGSAHGALLDTAVTAACRTRPAGHLASNPAIHLPERHLGLVTAGESLTEECLGRMADWIGQGVDLDALVALARERSGALEFARRARVRRSERAVRIGVARDNAFCFYYQDNLDLLASAGAELVEFSPLADAALPAGIGGLYLGGGYPEVRAASLSDNRAMREAICRLAMAGAPVYAECGGFMYLTEAIVDAEGREHPMVGIFPTRARMQPRLAALGYVEAEALDEDGWLRPGEWARGHEFRYSEIDAMPTEIARSFRLTGRHGARTEGYRRGSVIGGYAHLHFASLPAFAARFVDACAQAREGTL
jgi:cobyrinic acid a,c-diamide synthase